MNGDGTMEWGYTGKAGEPTPPDLRKGALNYNIFELEGKFGTGLIDSARS